jgi:hypothetical protein
MAKRTQSAKLQDSVRLSTPSASSGVEASRIMRASEARVPGASPGGSATHPPLPRDAPVAQLACLPSETGGVAPRRVPRRFRLAVVVRLRGLRPLRFGRRHLERFPRLPLLLPRDAPGAQLGCLPSETGGIAPRRVPRRGRFRLAVVVRLRGLRPLRFGRRHLERFPRLPLLFAA